MEYIFEKKQVENEADYYDALISGYVNLSLPPEHDAALFALLDAKKDTSDLVSYAYATRLLYGMGCEQEAETAFALLSELAEQGFTPAWRVLSQCYAEGLGTEPSAQLARLWGEKADAAEEAASADEEVPTDTEPSAGTVSAPSPFLTSCKRMLTRTKNALSPACSKAWTATKRFAAPYKFTGFHLTEKKTTVRRELLGGLTTFFAMAYIILLQPTYLSIPGVGMPKGGVMIATCIAAALGTLLTAFLANVPFAQAPGMGLNAFFAYTLCIGMGYTWNQALAIVLISGFCFLVISLTPLRKRVIAAIPAPLKSAITAGIGLFIAFVGLLSADIVVLTGDATTGGNGYAALGDIFSPMTGLAVLGLLITSILLVLRFKGAITLGIVLTTLIGFLPFFGQTTLPTDWSLLDSFSDFGKIVFAIDIGGAFTASAGLMGLLTAVLSCIIVDMFDTVGTLVGTAGSCGMLDAEGNLPDGDRALVADALATCVGACVGASTVTTYAESSTGIKAGARTGLASVMTGGLFALCIFLAPLATLVPAAATAPAMIIVGVMMMQSVAKINWTDLEEAIPCFLTVAMMPFAYSITDGIAFGLVTWCVLKLVKGKGKEVNPYTYGISGVFLLMYLLEKLFV